MFHCVYVSIQFSYSPGHTHMFMLFDESELSLVLYSAYMTLHCRALYVASRYRSWNAISRRIVIHNSIISTKLATTARICISLHHPGLFPLLAEKYWWLEDWGYSLYPNALVILTQLHNNNKDMSLNNPRFVNCAVYEHIVTRPVFCLSNASG